MEASSNDVRHGRDTVVLQIGMYSQVTVFSIEIVILEGVCILLYCSLHERYIHRYALRLRYVSAQRASSRPKLCHRSRDCA